jgi:phosphoenolpyruvate carboxykinase (ATP)
MKNNEVVRMLKVREMLLKKKVVRKAERVPIDIMAAIQRGDLKGTNVYETGILGRQAVVKAEGESLDRYHPRNYYSQDEIDDYLRDLVKGRMKYTEEISEEGLKPEILEAAESSFSIMPKRKGRVFVSRPEGGGRSGEARGEEVEEEESPVDRFWQPAGRMPLPSRWRHR